MSESKRNLGGRPPIYTDEHLSYLAASLTRWVNGLAERKEFGMLGDWCFDEAFNPKYFARYAEKHEEFREAYEWAKAWQEHIVSKGALQKTLDARFAQFFLGCCHRWRTTDPNEDKLTQLRSEFGKYLDLMKSSQDDEEE